MLNYRTRDHRIRARRSVAPSKMTHHIWSAAFIAAVAIPIAAVAGDGAADIVKERRELMQAMAQEMDEIAKRIATKRDLAAIGETAIKVRQAGERKCRKDQTKFTAVHWRIRFEVRGAVVPSECQSAL